MDLTSTKKLQFQKALITMKEVLQYHEHNSIVRDSSIQRFAYTAEIFLETAPRTFA